MKTKTTIQFAFCAFLVGSAFLAYKKFGETSICNSPFGQQDVVNFKTPPRENYPETWFHYIGGNVSLEGITADLEAISSAGIKGVQFFHGQFGGKWPKVDEEIKCLSPKWEGTIRHTAQEAKRLGLRFTMQNCPGWAMSGGPWIEPKNAMRDLAFSRTDLKASGNINVKLPIPVIAKEDWRDYTDVAVLAFPTPDSDTGTPISPTKINGESGYDWQQCFSLSKRGKINLPAVKDKNPHWVELEFPKGTTIRTIQFPSVKSFSASYVYLPDVHIKVVAQTEDGRECELLNANLTPSTWQDESNFTFACPETKGVKKCRVEFTNKNDASLSQVRFYSGARKNSFESEAGWTLRGIERSADSVKQSSNAYIKLNSILDISKYMLSDGTLNWTPPTKCDWTILRIGHINKGCKNSPAPLEATGWECDKLSVNGATVHFNSFMGKLNNTAYKGGLLDGMLLDSWECKTQTWTVSMEREFARVSGYELRSWLPAIFGFVIENPEITGRFLLDWRWTIDELFTEKFFGTMAELTAKNNLSVTFETAAGDIFPADFMKYFKYSSSPMCEFWHPFSDGSVGSINFKPIKPTASAARIYGKPRVVAEAFTSFELTWDEHWDMLRDIANFNMVEGVTHIVFHTYTHNPQVDFLPPGTSMGYHIGTPFLRGQTWWKYMPYFTSYLARCSYMLERGKSVSDILWYIGDELPHKPDQTYPFPEGFKYDYLNQDVLINRISVKDGLLTTPEGLTYKAIWLYDNKRMRNETLEKLKELILQGATVIADAPKNLATLSGSSSAEKKFKKLVKEIWKDSNSNEIKLGKGKIITGLSISQAIQKLGYKPQVKGKASWLHRKVDGADIYFVAAPQGESFKKRGSNFSPYPDYVREPQGDSFKGKMLFDCDGEAEIWNPVNGEITGVEVKRVDGYSEIELDLQKAESCFIVFRKNAKAPSKQSQVLLKTLDSDWTLSFPKGWGTPEKMELKQLKAWKDLDMSAEGKAFSGTATYSKKFKLENFDKNASYILNLGKVDMIADVFLNGKSLGAIWCAPYKLDISSALKEGENILEVKVTSTWFNRLVYDAGQPEKDRKTWTLYSPKSNFALKDSGLLGGIAIYKSK